GNTDDDTSSPLPLPKPPSRLDGLPQDSRSSLAALLLRSLSGSGDVDFLDMHGFGLGAGDDGSAADLAAPSAPPSPTRGGGDRGSTEGQPGDEDEEVEAPSSDHLRDLDDLNGLDDMEARFGDVGTQGDGDGNDGAAAGDALSDASSGEEVDRELLILRRHAQSFGLPEEMLNASKEDLKAILDAMIGN
ncbi:unnamed protein product, partial [Symbiodinium sp. KB8]